TRYFMVSQVLDSSSEQPCRRLVDQLRSYRVGQQDMTTELSLTNLCLDVSPPPEHAGAGYHPACIRFIEELVAHCKMHPETKISVAVSKVRKTSEGVSP